MSVRESLIALLPAPPGPLLMLGVQSGNMWSAEMRRRLPSEAVFHHCFHGTQLYRGIEGVGGLSCHSHAILLSHMRSVRGLCIVSRVWLVPMSAKNIQRDGWT